MKLCMPTMTDNGLSAKVFEHFGSAPFFTIVDTESQKVTVIANSNQHHAHGMCHPAGALEGHEVDAVVCGGMGARAIQRLNHSGIKVFKANPGSVEAMIGQFKENSLLELTIQDACVQGHQH